MTPYYLVAYHLPWYPKRPNILEWPSSSTSSRPRSSSTFSAAPSTESLARDPPYTARTQPTIKNAYGRKKYVHDKFWIQYYILLNINI